MQRMGKFHLELYSRVNFNDVYLETLWQNKKFLNLKEFLNIQCRSHFPNIQSRTPPFTSFPFPARKRFLSC